MSNRHEIELDVDSVVTAAEQETGVALDDTGVRERLAKIVECYRNSGLDDVQYSMAAESLVEIMVVRLRLARDRITHLGITDEVVDRPIVIVGFPRAGTTFLHALLSVDPHNRAPEWWEVMHPSPPPGLAAADDHRRQLAQREVADFVRRCPGVRIAHPYFVEGDATIMECDAILTFDLRNTYPFALHRVPVYASLELLGDPVEAMGFHRMFLQNLQWQRDPRRWALKGTSYQFMLPALLETYPDAIVLWPHRDPVEFVASLVELNAVLVEGITGQLVDRRPMGRSLMETMPAGLAAAMAHPSIDAPNVVHLRYADFTKDPIGQLRSVYDGFGLPFTAEFESAIPAWMADERHSSSRYGRFEYSLERSGLDADEVRAAFADYIRRFGLD